MDKEPPPSSRPISDQSISRRLYRDPTTLLPQVLIALLIVIDFIFFNTLLPGQANWFFILLAITFVTLLLPRLTGGRLSQALTLQIIYHLLVGFFLVFVVPVNSYYEFLVFLLVYASIYWYGAKGLRLSLVTIAVIFLLSLLHQYSTIQFTDLINLAFKVALIALIGMLLERLHSLDLDERRALVSVSREATFEHNRLRSLINSMGDAVIATDQNGEILVYNGAALDLLNTNASLENKPFAKVVKIYNQAKRKFDIISQVEHTTAILKRDDLLLRVDKGDYLNLYISVAQIQLSYGEAGQEGFIMLMRDITKEKSIEEQRDEFISVVSHELRTPIAIAEANISTALLPNIAKEKTKMMDLLEQAHKNVVFLAEMVSDITTLAHAERGDLDAEIEDVRTDLIVKELAETYEQEAKEKNIKIRSELAKNLPLDMRSNAYRIKEILQNFMTNALRYTEKGSIVVRAEADPQGVRFSVKDTGIGISQSDQRHVFEKFWRSEDYRTRSHNGTGLGLYIAKKLAERMRGQVGLNSRLNHGSTFYLILPLDIQNPK